MASQLTEQRILKAEEFGNALHRLVKEAKIKDSRRTRAALAAFAISQDHHDAIVLLLKNGFYSSSFALLRSVTETYLRGLWLTHCATDSDVQKVMEGEKNSFPKNLVILRTIEDISGFEDRVLSSRINKTAWDIMCDFTHTGGLHLQRWQSKDGIEPTFDTGELEQCLTNAGLFAGMCAVEVLQMSADGNNGEAVLKLLEKR